MAYKRQIAYLDYMEFGEKKGSSGFCKWEQKNGVHTLEISINVLKQKVPEKVKIFTRASSELGDVRIQNGRALAVFSKKEEEGDWKWEFSKIKILLEEERELIAEFPVEEGTWTGEISKEEEPEIMPELEVVLAPEDLEAESEEEFPEFEAVLEPELPEPKAESEAELSEPKAEPEAKLPELESVSELQFEPILEAEPAEEMPLHSLWDCLARTHKMIYPFGTEEEYCRIRLEDIFLLKERYHILRNNQFLLHGYCNYKYLILGRKDQNSEEYWLGVPGIYHEREKMAARMYGFEKFEGARPRYSIGDLGYYLITVE